MSTCIGKVVVGIGMVCMAVVGVVGCQGGSTTHPPAHPATTTHAVRHTEAECHAAITADLKVELTKQAAGYDISKDNIEPSQCEGINASVVKGIASQVFAENIDAIFAAGLANAFNTTAP